MCGLYKKLVLSGVVLFLGSIAHATQLQLVTSSYEQCLAQSRTIKKTFEREHYLRAAVQTASAVVGLYIAYNYFFGEVQVAAAVPVPKSDFSWREAAKNTTWWLTKGVGQAICMQWVTRTLLTNNADPKVYIPKHIHYYYKTHGAEIERLLQMHAADDYLCNPSDDIDLLIQCHLQALVDKIEQLMAYILYYAPAYASTHTEVLVERYAHEVLKKVAIIVEQCNTASAENFNDAVITCKQQCADILTSAIRYALASLPSDE